MELYIGLMSGTSADGIDAVLIDFSQATPTIIDTHYTPYEDGLSTRVKSLLFKENNQIHHVAELDHLLGVAFAKAVNELLKKQSLPAKAIRAIGSHGQTIRHHPHLPYRFTMQIGDPNIIAAHTGITTVADFRRKDIAFGGQGAPLVPAFHQYLFANKKTPRAILNIGGIANITILATQKNHKNIIGYDSGPGNVLLNAWIKQHQNQPFDHHGNWAAQGEVDAQLLEILLEDDYFHQPPPKSTGPEYFNLLWLQQKLKLRNQSISFTNVQTTLTELTAQTIISAIQQHVKKGEILVCGGGVHNHFLMSRLKAIANKNFTVESSQAVGIDPDWIEAMAFAWLAKQTLSKKPGNLPSVTGATQTTVLGGIYFA